MIFDPQLLALFVATEKDKKVQSTTFGKQSESYFPAHSNLPRPKMLRRTAKKISPTHVSLTSGGVRGQDLSWH